MINELYSIKQSLSQWGIDFDQLVENQDLNWHSKLVTIPGNKKHPVYFKVYMGPNGVEEISSIEKPEGLRYYQESTHKYALMFRYDPAKEQEKRVQSLKMKIDCHQELCERLDDREELKSFVALCSRLKMSPEELDKQIQDKIDSTKYMYLFLEVSDSIKFPNSVQSMDCVEAINEILLGEVSTEVANESERDFYGNSAYGYESRGTSIESLYALGKMYFYSNNPANKCFNKWGSDMPFVIGQETRDQVSRMLTILCSESNRITRDKKGVYTKGLCYVMEHKTMGKKPKVLKKNLIITTMLPTEAGIEMNNFSNYEEWRLKNSKILSCLQAQRDSHPGTGGQILILKLPKERGPVNVENVIRENVSDIYNAHKQWFEGIDVCPSHFINFRPPSLMDVVRTLNSRWSFKSDGAGQECYESGRSNTVSIFDAYQFFFNNSAYVDRFTRLFESHHVPMMLQCSLASTKKTPFDLNYLFPIGGLIMNKNGFRSKEEVNDHYAFWLGYLLQSANRLHEAYFTSRNISVPRVLVGSQFIKMVRNNPQRALDLFDRRFQPYRDWAVKYIREKGKKYVALREINESMNKLREFYPLPTKMETCDSVALAFGYSYFPHKKKETESGKE